MSHASTRTVAIVLDPAFGAQLASLAGRAAVWVVDSPENRPTIESLWTARRTRGAEYDLTVFRMIPGLSPADHIDGVVRSLDRLRFDDDDAPAAPIGSVEVYGAAPDAAMRSTFEQFGFAHLDPLDDGFRARRGGRG